MPARGKALRDKIVLRLIAIDRVIHFVVLGLLGVAVLLFAADRAALRDAFYRVLTALQGGVAGGPVQTTGHVGILHELDRLFTLRSGTLHVGRDRPAGLRGARGRRGDRPVVGQALGRVPDVHLHHAAACRWRSTRSSTRASALKVIGFLINVAVVVYLLLRKRLFGLRGGGAADEAERRTATGWERDRAGHAGRSLAAPARGREVVSAPAGPAPLSARRPSSRSCGASAASCGSRFPPARATPCGRSTPARWRWPPATGSCARRCFGSSTWSRPAARSTTWPAT